jgi:hypothetical protein
VETGSTATASATNQSPHGGDFRGRRQIPCIGAFRGVGLVSGFLALCLYGRHGRSVSAPKNHFSWETETDLTRDWFEGGHHSVRSGLPAIYAPPCGVAFE